MRLSVQIPTRNEEKNIAQLIKNIRDVADEILLLDNSDDATVYMARLITKKVKAISINLTGLENIGRIRNIGLSETKCDYALCLDADEAISEEFKKSLMELKKKKNPATTYWTKREHFMKIGDHIAHLIPRIGQKELRLGKVGCFKFTEHTHEIGTNLCTGQTRNIKGNTLHYPNSNKYTKGEYREAHLKTIKPTKMIKQLIKYLINMDYQVKYLKGNLLLIKETFKQLIGVK